MSKLKFTFCTLPLFVMAAMAVHVACADPEPAKSDQAQTQPANAEQPQAQPAKNGIKPEDAVKGDKDLAGRFASLAQETLRQKLVLPPHFRESAALLMAAMKLDPEEPRYPRMLYEAMLQIRDQDGAFEALKAYRKLVPNDQVAMVAYIDMKIRRMENAEERGAELSRLLDTPAVPSEVRSHVAFRLYQLAGERGESDKQQAMLAQALRLNPLNLDALRAKLAEQSENGTPTERVGTMLQMLKSNPVQPQVTYRVARECADAGLPDESLQFYTRTVELANAMSVSMGREFAVGYASELYVKGQPQLLGNVKFIAEQLLKADSGDVEALLLRWLAERAGDDKDAPGKTTPQIVNATLNRLLTLRQQLGVTGAGATTRPVDSTDALAIPDLSEDFKKLQEEKYAPLAAPYAQAVADLAWYLVYANDKPAEAAKLLPTLKSLLGDTDPVATRIEGWIALSDKQLDKAKLKLNAVADQDVLARMGVLLMAANDPAQKDTAQASARKLLLENPSGLLAAILMDRLKPLNVKLVARQDAGAIQQLVNQFPADWFRIIAAPQTFYTIKAEMLDGKVRFGYAQPMFARVTLRNTSQYDITLGPEGVIKSDLWFDAQFRGLVQQTVTGAAYDRLAGSLVLRPGQVISQVVRLDQGQLATVLTGNPQPVLTFYGWVRTNPRGEGGCLPCGYPVVFSNITEREGFALGNQGLNVLNNQIASGSPAEKLRGMELISALLEALKPQVANNPNAQAVVTGFNEALNRAQVDPSEAVATWGSFLTAVQSSDKRAAILEKFLADPAPERRLLGLLMANSFPPAQQIERLKKILPNDKQEMVQLYGAAMLEIAEVALNSQKNAPATAPSNAAAPVIETPQP